MKNTLILSLTFAATLMASSVFAEGAHHGEMEGRMAAQEGHMGMMHGDMKMDKNRMAMMKKRSTMMSKCVDEIEKDSPNPVQLELCAKMMRKQADMMGTCMEKGYDMMKKDKKQHDDDNRIAGKNEK